MRESGSGLKNKTSVCNLVDAKPGVNHLNAHMLERRVQMVLPD